MNEAQRSECRVERLVICFRYAWCWLGFWRGWYHEAKGVPMLAWLGLVGVVAAAIQIVSVVFFPVWRLLVEPIKVGLTCTATQAENLKRILGR